MALQQTYVLPKGLNLSFIYPQFELCISKNDYTLQNAYIKIINLNASKTNVILNIGIYDTKDGNFITSDTFEFVPDLSTASTNFIKQGYEQLKLNKYPNAIDLLDEGQIG